MEQLHIPGENRRILRDAKGVLEQYGWIQESYGNPETGYCLEGALDCAVAANELSFNQCTATARARQFIRRAIEDSAGPTPFAFQWNSLVLWNDRPERTLEEVIKVLDYAMELAN